jgi:hypothetical protein
LKKIKNRELNWKRQVNLGAEMTKLGAEIEEIKSLLVN